MTLPAPVPPVHPETRPFWDATAEGRLLLPRCAACPAVIWYPRGICPECASTEIEWFEASGRGVIYSRTINRRGLGAYKDAGAYVLAYVELEEGPRVMTNIVDCDPETISIGDAVEATFHETGEGPALVRFRPAS